MASGVIDRMETTFELLWTNPSPLASAGFSAQTVSLDLSTYDAVFIVFIANLNYDRMATAICPKKSGYNVLTTAIPSATAVRARNATVTDNGVQFSSGYSGTSASETSAIPYRIYGIRGLALS